MILKISLLEPFSGEKLIELFGQPNSIFSCLLWPDAELGTMITAVYKLDKDPSHN